MEAYNQSESQLRHRPTGRLASGETVTSPTKMVSIPVAAVPLRLGEVDVGTPTEEVFMIGEYPEVVLDDGYTTDEEEPTLTEVAKDAAVGIRNTVGHLASAAGSLLTIAARRVSGSGPSIAAVASSPELRETVQGAASRAAESYQVASERSAAQTANLPARVEGVVMPVVERAGEAATIASQSVQSAYHKSGELAEHALAQSHRSLEVAAERGHHSLDAVKSIVGPAVQATVESTKEAYYRSEANTTRVLEHVGDVTVEYGTTARVLATDAFHNVESVGASVVHKTVDVASNAAHATAAIAHTAEELGADVLHKTVHVASGAARSTAIVGQDVLHKVENVGATVFHKTTNVASGAAHFAGDTSQAAARGAINTAATVGHGVAGAAAGVAHVASSVAHGTIDKSVGAARAVTGTVSHAAQSTANTASHIAQGTANTAIGATRAVTGGISNATTTVGQGAVGATRAVTGGISSATTTVGHRAVGATRAVTGGICNATTAVGYGAAGVATGAAHAVSNVAHGTLDTASNATHTVAGAVSNVASGASYQAANTVHAASSATTGVLHAAGNAGATVVNKTVGITSAAAHTVTDTTAAIGHNLLMAAATVGQGVIDATTGLTHAVSNVAHGATQSAIDATHLVTLNTANVARVATENTPIEPSSLATPNNGLLFKVAQVPGAVGHTASQAAHTVVSIPVAVGRQTLNAVSGAASGASNAASTAIHTVAAIPTAIGRQTMNAASTAASGVSNAASTVASIPSALSDMASRTQPVGTKLEASDAGTIAAPGLGVRVPVEYREGAMPDPNLGGQEQIPTPLEDIEYAEEVERERRARPGATGRQYYNHSHEQARAFADGFRESLGESGNIPALSVPRRELIREAEDVEREERARASKYQRSIATQQARAFSEGLVDGSGQTDRLHSAGDRARLHQVEAFEEKEREERIAEMDPSASRRVASAVKEGIVLDASDENNAVHKALREMARTAEETARDERINVPQREAQVSAEKVASLFQAGIAGGSETRAAGIAKLGQIRDAEDVERSERVHDEAVQRVHANDEASIVKAGLEQGLDLHPVPASSSYRLNESRKLEEQERLRRMRESSHADDAAGTAEALRKGLEEQHGRGGTSAAVEIATRELLKSAEEDERSDRIASQDSLRAVGSPTLAAFAVRSGLLHDDNAAVDVARQAAEHDGISDPLNGKPGAGIAPSKAQAKAPGHRHVTTVYDQEKGKHQNQVPGPTIAYQNWGHGGPVRGGSLGDDLQFKGNAPSIGSLAFEAGSSTEEPRILNEELVGRQTPPSTPVPAASFDDRNSAQSSSAHANLILSNISGQATQHPDGGVSTLQVQDFDRRPTTPERGDSILLHPAPATATVENERSDSQEDLVGMYSIRPAPSSDPNAVMVSTPPRSSSPAHPDEHSRTSDESGRRPSNSDKPHKFRAALEKTIGKIETKIGKVMHNEHLIVDGQERQHLNSSS